MTASWVAVLGACAVCFGIKLLGFLARPHWLEGQRVQRVSGQMTIALLSALLAVQTVASGRHLGLDARVPAVAMAGVLLWRRAPFVVVIVAAAAVAAGLRLAAA